MLGISVQEQGAGELRAIGTPVVADPVSAIAGDRARDGLLRRHAASFFQGNRYLLSSVVLAVAAALPDAGGGLDLYAGVGLFSVALAALGRGEVTAVEGDRITGGAPCENARPHAPPLHCPVRRGEA